MYCALPTRQTSRPTRTRHQSPFTMFTHVARAVQTRSSSTPRSGATRRYFAFVTRVANITERVARDRRDRSSAVAPPPAAALSASSRLATFMLSSATAFQPPQPLAVSAIQRAVLPAKRRSAEGQNEISASCQRVHRKVRACSHGDEQGARCRARTRQLSPDLSHLS